MSGEGRVRRRREDFHHRRPLATARKGLGSLARQKKGEKRGEGGKRAAHRARRSALSTSGATKEGGGWAAGRKKETPQSTTFIYI